MIKYNFIIPVKTVDEVIYFSNVDLHNSWQIFAVGDFCWSLQTYLVLKKCGLPVALSNRFRRGCINIAGGRTLQNLWKPIDVFVVDIKADVPRDYIGRELQIVQNKAMEDFDRKRFYIPLWPQANLIKRDPGRYSVVNLAYAGRLNNLLHGKKDLSDTIEKLGLKFKVLTQENWNNYSDIDICIGIRSFDNKPYIEKPATKLYNAWHAQVPFIGGNESAFNEAGIPGENYLRVGNEEAFIEAIIQLRDNKELYNTLVQNGNKSKNIYDWDSIAKQWIHFLEEIAVPEYENWQNLSTLNRSYQLVRKTTLILPQRFLRFPKSVLNIINNLIKYRLKTRE